MNKLRAILFDLDGTLIDSESFHFDCWNEVLSPYKIQLKYNQYLDNYAGVSLAENSRKLIELYKLKVSLTMFMEARQKLYAEKLSRQPIQLMPYALETIKFFNSLNISLGLVTSSSRAEVNIILHNCDLRSYFSSIITRDDVKNHKPHPAPYNASLAALALLKDECIVFEDTLSGVVSAKEAGITCYAIQGNINEATKLQGVADMVFISLDEAKEYLLNSKIL